jgi:hypothetical protein
MYTLANDTLEVSILDPIADQGRFGVRYCTGGYIFEITDKKLGNLMTGPTYPDKFNWFDGQGIPDAFHLAPLRDQAATDTLGLILGIGLCDIAAREVKEFCTWAVTQTSDSITMRTDQSYQNYAVTLERTVSLKGRTIRSFTHIWNHSPSMIPMRWYPHPFYPQMETGDELIKLNIPLAPIEDEGYFLGDNGFINRKGWKWEKGYFLSLNHTPTTNLVVIQKHPKLGLVAGTCSYAPDYFPIWGNPLTFSWEPYLEHSIGHGQEFSWWIDYEF